LLELGFLEIGLLGLGASRKSRLVDAAKLGLVGAAKLGLVDALDRLLGPAPAGVGRLVGACLRPGACGCSDSAPASASASASSRVTVSLTLVPQPEGLMTTLPLVSPACHSTRCSGSTRVMRISPNSPRWRARAAGSLISAHSSGGDLTSVRCTSEEIIVCHFAR
jgi:hypothetical protein